MKKVFVTLRLLFLLASMLFAGLSLFPSDTEAIKCPTGCGTSGPLACAYPCRRPE